MPYIPSVRDITILYPVGIATMATSSYPSNWDHRQTVNGKSLWLRRRLSPPYWKILPSIQFPISLTWEWADACLDFLKQSLTVSLAGDDSSSCSSSYPKSHPPTYAHVPSFQPHPQPCYSNAKQSNPQELPAKKPRFTTLSNEELEGLSKACVPKNTESSTKWALENFKSWMSDRNSHSTEKCPESLLEDMDPTLLDKWLSAFVAETRKVNGDPYPPTSLHLLLSGLQCHMRSIDREEAPNIFCQG